MKMFYIKNVKKRWRRRKNSYMLSRSLLCTVPGTILSRLSRLRNEQRIITC